MGLPKTRDLGSIRAVQQVLSVGPNLEERDIFYVLKMADGPVLWKALLDLQYGLCKTTELPFLYRSGCLTDSRTVLEIGYGDEELSGGLAPFFPDKKFTNVSLPTRDILGAKTKTRICLEDIAAQVKQSGLSTFDCLILRVVVQKVSQLGLFIDTVKDYLSKDGKLLIIDSNDSLLGWQPPIPTLDNLMKSLASEQEKTGAGRSAAEKIYRRASLYGLRPRVSEKLAVSSTGEAGLRDFYTYFLLLSEVMVRAYGPVLNQTALLADLNAWIADPGAKAQFGLHFAELERN